MQTITIKKGKDIVGLPVLSTFRLFRGTWIFFSFLIEYILHSKAGCFAKQASFFPVHSITISVFFIAESWGYMSNLRTQNSRLSLFFPKGKEPGLTPYDTQLSWNSEQRAGWYYTSWFLEHVLFLGFPFFLSPSFFFFFSLRTRLATTKKLARELWRSSIFRRAPKGRSNWSLQLSDIWGNDASLKY